MTPVLTAVSAAYLALIAGVSFWSWRRTRTAADFFVAGRGLGLWVTALATMSSAFSGFLFLGGPGLTYRIGVASWLIVLPIGVTGGLLAWTVAKRLRLLAEVRSVYTVPDAVLARYGCRRTAGLAALAVILGTVAYLAAQLLALGILVQTLFDFDARFGAAALPLAVGCGWLVVTTYSAVGGMVAGVYTDVLQGVLMIAAALGVFFFAWQATGGPSSAIDVIAASETFGAAFLDPLGGRAPALLGLSFFFVFAVGVLGQPHTLHKFLMLEDPRRLRYLPAVLGLSQALVVLLWLGVGLAVPALVASGALAPMESPDQVTPMFLLHHTPPWLAGWVFAGVLAAIMSTADSFINIASAALVRDLPRALGLSPRDEVRRGRRASVLVSAAAAGVALAYGDLIALLGTFAYGIFAAALTPCLAVGLSWKRAGANAASASIATGLSTVLLFELWAKQSWLELPPSPLAPGVLPAVPAMAAAFVVFLGVAWWRPAPAPPADVEAVMDL